MATTKVLCFNDVVAPQNNFLTNQVRACTTFDDDDYAATVKYKYGRVTRDDNFLNYDSEYKLIPGKDWYEYHDGWDYENLPMDGRKFDEVDPDSSVLYLNSKCLTDEMPDCIIQIESDDDDVFDYDPQHHPDVVVFDDYFAIREKCSSLYNGDWITTLDNAKWDMCHEYDRIFRGNDPKDYDSYIMNLYQINSKIRDVVDNYRKDFASAIPNLSLVPNCCFVACKEQEEAPDNCADEFNTLMQEKGWEPFFKYDFNGPPNNREWYCTLRVFKYKPLSSWKGTALTKQGAKNIAVCNFMADYHKSSNDSDLPRLDVISNCDVEETRDASGLDTVEPIQEQNTTLTNASGSDEETVIDLASGEVLTYVDGGLSAPAEFVERYIKLPAVVWSADDVDGTILARFSLPRDALLANIFSPNMVPHAVYALARYGLRVQCQTNSTRFHAGTLVIGARYNVSPALGNQIQHSDQIVPMNSVLCQAASSQTDTINIDFMHCFDMVGTSDSLGSVGAFYVSLYFGVLNRLRIAEGSSPTITIQPYVSFKTPKDPTQFAIQRKRRPIVDDCPPEAAAIKALNLIGNGNFATTLQAATTTVEKTAKGVGAILRNTNFDRPVIPVDRSSLYIQPTVDMAVGDGPQDLVSMRLQKNTVTPFDPRRMNIRENQFRLEYLLKVYGVIRNFEWRTDSPEGSLLFIWSVCPIEEDLAFKGLYPPVTEVSSHFLMRTGNLNLKFVFGSSEVHSGRVRVIFVPDLEETPTNFDAHSYPYLIFDLQTQQIFTYTVPNIFNTELMPIYFRDDATNQHDVFSFGKVLVQVETPLKMVSSVSNVISCTVMLAGDDNYRCLVPGETFIKPLPTVQAIGNSNFDAGERLNSGQKLSAADIHNSNMQRLLGENFNIFNTNRRYNRIAQNNFSIDVDTVNPVDSYEFAMNVNFGTPFKRTGLKPLDFLSSMHDGFRYSRGSLCYIFDIHCDVPCKFRLVHIPVSSRIISQAQIRPRTIGSDTIELTGYANQIVKQGVNTVIPINVPFYHFVNFLANYFDPEAVNFGALAPFIYSNGVLSLIFQPCDRNYSGKLNVDITVFRALGDDAEMFCFQGFPRRSIQPIRKIPVMQSRPLDASSAFVLFLPGDPLPTGFTDPFIARIFSLQENGSWSTTSGPYSSRDGFPEMLVGPNDRLVIRLSINDSVMPPPSISNTVERQVYSDETDVAYNYLSSNPPGQPADRQVIDNQWRARPVTMPVTYHIYDARVRPTLSPILPLIGNSDFTPAQPPKTITVQEMCSKLCSLGYKDFRFRKHSKDLARKGALSFVKFYNYYKNNIFYDSDTIIANMDVMSSVRSTVASAMSVPASVNEAAESVRGAAETVQQSSGLISATLESIHELAKGALSKFEGVLGDKMDAVKVTLVNLVFNLFTLLKSTELKIRIAAFCAIFVNLGILAIDTLSTWFGKLYNFIRVYILRRPTTDPAVANSDFSDDDKVKAGMDWFKLLVPAIVCTLGLKQDYAKQGIKAFQNYFTSTIRASNDLSTFFYKNVDIVRRVAYWAVGTANPHLEKIAILQDQKEEMEQWALEVISLTQGHMRERVQASASLQKKLDYLFIQGSHFLTLIKDKNIPHSAFMNLYNKLYSLHQSIGQRVGRGRLSREPCVLWLSGLPGCGKSNVSQAIAEKFLVEHGVVFDGAFNYVRNSTNFWNGYCDQPCVTFDDLFQNRSQDVLSREISEFFSICSVAEYNAEMAAIEDKDRMVNPDIVCVNSNSSYPATTAISDINALYRRRDVLAFCRLSASAKSKGNAENPVLNANDPRIPTEMLQKFEHLEFKIMNPLVATNDPAENANEGFMDYIAFSKHVVDTFTRIRKRRMEASVSRLASGFSLSTDRWMERLRSENSMLDASIRANVMQQVEQNNSDNGRIGFSDNAQSEITEATFQSVIPQPIAPITPNCDICDFSVPQDRFIHSPFVVNPDEITNQYPPCICEYFIAHGTFCQTTRMYVLDLATDMTSVPGYAGLSPWQGVFANKRYVRCAVNAFCSDRCTMQNWRHRRSRFWARYSHTIADVMDVEQLLFSDVEQIDYRRLVEDGLDGASLLSSYPPIVVEQHSFFKRFINKVCSISSSIFSVLTTAACVLIVTAGIVWLALKIYRLVTLDKEAWTELGKNMRRYLSQYLFATALRRLIGNINTSGDVQTAKFKGNKLNITNVRTAGVREVIANNDMEEASEIPDDHIKYDDIIKTAQMTGAKDNADQLEYRIWRNTLGIRVYAKNANDDPWVELGSGSNVIMLVGQLGLCPFHYAYGIANAISKYKYSKCELSFVDQSHSIVNLEVKFDDLIFNRLGKLDVSYIRFPNSLPCFKKLYGYFATETEANSFRMRGKIYNGRASTLAGVEICYTEHIKRVEATATYEGIDDVYLLGYEYPYAGKGKCGTLLLDPRKNKIIGIHVASDVNETIGYSIALCREIIEPIISNQEREEIDISDEVKGRQSHFVANGTLTRICSVNKKHKLACITKTQIRRSKVCGIIAEPQRFPAKLYTPGEKIRGYTALKIGVEKQCNPQLPFPKQIVDKVIKDMAEEIVVKAKPVGFKTQSVLTLEEAILGRVDIPFMEGIKLGTSPGWPLCSKFPGKSKAYFVDVDFLARRCIIGTELLQIYNVNHQYRLDNKVPPTVYADFLKDERLKEGKDTRLINGAPFDHTIEWRRYAMEFFAAYQSAGVEVGSAIGLNVFANGFNQIANALLKVSDRIITADYSNFGPSIQSEFINGLKVIMRTWYSRYTTSTEEDHQVRDILVEELVRCKHIAGDLIYQVHSGCPSGNPFTAPINTIANHMYFRVAWLLIFQGKPLGVLSAYHRYYKHIAYGDDSIGAVHPKISEFYNCRTISKILAQYNVKVTDAQKTVNIKPFDKLSSSEFLKCYFRRHDHRDKWVATLRMEVVVDIPNWIREPCPNENAQIKDNLDQVLRFISLYGSATYHTLCTKLSEKLRDTDIFISIPDWVYVDTMLNDERSQYWPDEPFYL